MRSDVSFVPPVGGDPARLHQCVLNLVANACQHGGDDIDVVIGECVDDREVTVSVIDHGSGIAPDLAEKVFLPFYRGDDSLFAGRSRRRRSRTRPRRADRRSTPWPDHVQRHRGRRCHLRPEHFRCSKTNPPDAGSAPASDVPHRQIACRRPRGGPTTSLHIGLKRTQSPPPERDSCTASRPKPGHQPIGTGRPRCRGHRVVRTVKRSVAGERSQRSEPSAVRGNPDVLALTDAGCSDRSQRSEPSAVRGNDHAMTRSGVAATGALGASVDVGPQAVAAATIASPAAQRDTTTRAATVGRQDGNSMHGVSPRIGNRGPVPEPDHLETSWCRRGGWPALAATHDAAWFENGTHAGEIGATKLPRATSTLGFYIGSEEVS